MTHTDRRSDGASDRRRVARGGRRDGDRPGGHPLLLVADSYDGVRIPCVRYLNKFGFQVDEAADGIDALAKIDAAPPHVIVVESGLPNAPVSKILRRLRDRPDTKAIPVVVMASDLDWGEDGVADAPLVAVLVKPFALAAMLEEVRRLLREQPSVTESESISADVAAGASV